jgi:general secretion pathway protein F
MNTFKVKVRTRTGAVRDLDVVATDKASAMALGRRQGMVLSAEKIRSFGFSKVFQPADRQIFFTRLSAMLGSRVGTSDALKLLRDNFGGKIRDVSSRLLDLVESGDDLAAAFVKIGAPDFPEATVALIQAGARSGETWRAIKDAADLEYQLSIVKKGASSGLWMGIGSFLFAGITTVVSTMYIGPKILGSDLIKASAGPGGGVDIGWITTTGNIMGYTMAALMSIGIFMWILAIAGRRIAPVKADHLILKIPYYKDLVLARNNYITLYGLALLVKSGVRTEEALRLSSLASPPGALRRDLANAQQAVKLGKPWATALSTFHPTDKAALMSSVDREQVYTTLDQLSKQYRDLYAKRLASFVPALNLMSALFLSLAGGILFGESILPMLMASKGLLGG